MPGGTLFGTETFFRVLSFFSPNALLRSVMRYHDAQSQARRALADGNFVAANSLLIIFPVRPLPMKSIFPA
jgi:hypothetical protein